MDFESNSDEGKDEEIPINQRFQFPLTPNHMDYGSSSDEGQDEKILINQESQFPHSPNPMNFESSRDEGKDKDGEEYPPIQYFKTIDDGIKNFHAANIVMNIFQTMMVVNFLTILKIIIVRILFLLLIMEILVHRMMK